MDGIGAPLGKRTALVPICSSVKGDTRSGMVVVSELAICLQGGVLYRPLCGVVNQTMAVGGSIPFVSCITPREPPTGEFRRGCALFVEIVQGGWPLCRSR